VPTIGLEPILLKGKQILSLPCLPIPPSGLKIKKKNDINKLIMKKCGERRS
jgi:hypothetical protein